MTAQTKEKYVEQLTVIQRHSHSLKKISIVVAAGSAIAAAFTYSSTAISVATVSTVMVFIFHAFETFAKQEKELSFILLTVASAGLLCIPSPPARAGGGGSFAGATEITQIANNVELAMQSVQQEIHSVELIKSNYFQAMQQMKAAGSGYKSNIDSTAATYNTILTANRSLQMLAGSLSTVDKMISQRRTEFGASNLTWQGYVDREGRLIDSGNQAAIAQVTANRAALENTQSSIDAYQQAAADMQATTGTHAATQQLGYQLSIMGGDINKLLSLTAQRNIVKAQQDQDALNEREQNKKNLEELISRQKTINDESTSVIQKYLKNK